jgi:hypothetical protein
MVTRPVSSGWRSASSAARLNSGSSSMGQGDLARAGVRPAADQRRQRRGVMRITERPLARQSAAAQAPGNRLNHPELECFGRLERRQYAGEPCGQHRLPRSRRTDHQEIVPTGRGDLERALGAFLALDVLKVGARRARGGKARFRRRQELGTLEMVDDRQQARRGNDLDLARPGRLAAATGGTDDAAAAARRRQRRKQYPGDAGQRAVERQLSQHRVLSELVRRQNIHRRQQRQGDRQIEMAAFLKNVGRGEVHGDPSWRQSQAQGAERCPYPLARLGNRLVRQSDHGEGRQPGGDRHLRLDLDDLDAVERHRPNPRNHGLTIPQGKVEFSRSCTTNPECGGR